MTVINLETELREMSERSVLFRMIRDEMERRGHWKAKARRIPPRNHFKELRSVTTDIQSDYVRQVTDETGFSDWGV